MKITTEIYLCCFCIFLISIFGYLFILKNTMDNDKKTCGQLAALSNTLIEKKKLQQTAFYAHDQLLKWQKGNSAYQKIRLNATPENFLNNLTSTINASKLQLIHLQPSANQNTINNLTLITPHTVSLSLTGSFFQLLQLIDNFHQSTIPIFICSIVLQKNKQLVIDLSIQGYYA